MFVKPYVINGRYKVQRTNLSAPDQASSSDYVHMDVNVHALCHAALVKGSYDLRQPSSSQPSILGIAVPASALGSMTGLSPAPSAVGRADGHQAGGAVATGRQALDACKASSGWGQAAPHGAGSWHLFGVWRPAAQAGRPRPANFLEMGFTADFHLMRGSYFSGQKRVPWDAVKDDRITVAYKRDYGTLWKQGVEVFTNRCRAHTVHELIGRSLIPSVAGGGNRVDCENCGQRADHTQTPVVLAAPRHLLVVLSRMEWRADLHNIGKHLATVRLHHRLDLPTIPQECAGIATAASEGALDGVSRSYALYAVVVHSGMTANSGHYYAYARRSAAPGATLLAKDDPAAPWYRLNDSSISKTSWEEMTSRLSCSLTDSAFLLLYKRIDATQVARGAGEPEDAASQVDEDLAAALRLSMQQQASGPEPDDEAIGGVDKPEDFGVAPKVPAWIMRIVRDNDHYVSDVLGAWTSDTARAMQLESRVHARSRHGSGV